MAWLKVGIITMIICAVMLVAVLVLLSVVQKGFDLRSILTRLFRDMSIIGGVAGALVPLFVIFVLKFRPEGSLSTITALLVFAGVVGGAAAGLFYAEMLARLHRG